MPHIYNVSVSQTGRENRVESLSKEEIAAEVKKAVVEWRGRQVESALSDGIRKVSDYTGSRESNNLELKFESSQYTNL